jgi:sugar lactone lactonase YvrE
VPAKHHGKLKDLAVSDFGTDAVEVLNSKYDLVATIKAGLESPDGDYYDSKGNLYVSNYAGADVTEYNKSDALTHTYSSGLTDPIGVTTDAHGNVFVADFGNFAASVVTEYPQGSNSPSASCNTGLANEDVAVDKSGNVFVSGANTGVGYGVLLEYKNGLTGCSSTRLDPLLDDAGGLIIDKHNDLVACDQLSGVDIIPPQYYSISATIPEDDAFTVALNKKETLLYIAQPNEYDVLVVKYPAGTTVTTLGSGNGLSDPAGVATYPSLK